MSYNLFGENVNYPTDDELEPRVRARVAPGLTCGCGRQIQRYDVEALPDREIRIVCGRCHDQVLTVEWC
jgi:hypothetical protein